MRLSFGGHPPGRLGPQRLTVQAVPALMMAERMSMAAVENERTQAGMACLAGRCALMNGHERRR